MLFSFIIYFSKVKYYFFTNFTAKRKYSSDTSEEIKEDYSGFQFTGR